MPNPIKEVIMKEFDEKFVTRSVFGVAIGCIDGFDGNAEDKVRNFLSSSLDTYLRLMIEEIMPRNCISAFSLTKQYKNGFNNCRSAILQRLEELLDK